jgi:hypothetical protein
MYEFVGKRPQLVATGDYVPLFSGVTAALPTATDIVGFVS